MVVFGADTIAEIPLPKIIAIIGRQNKRNKQRDGEITKFLKRNGWQVIRIWECELKEKNRKKLMLKLSLIKQ
ncbi:MAG: very short patch repair endonuclease [Endomicrobium sp.]|jgi:G:T-mismatch repair DNA endonuclease (very short patch repair protein)|nr:very short patch repair endonuclease [Endomicrobium sp.]